MKRDIVAPPLQFPKVLLGVPQAIGMKHHVGDNNKLGAMGDNWDNRWKEDQVVEGSQNDKIIDKLVTLPDLLTSIIEHCEAAIGNNKKNIYWAVENQQETGLIELSYKGGPIVLPEGEDGSKETELNNLNTVKLPKLQPSLATNALGNSIEEQDLDAHNKLPSEHNPRTKQQPQLTRRQKKKLKKTLKATKKPRDRAALGITSRYPVRSRPTQSSGRNQNQE
ncbi:hypothetical protein NDU88_003166 [Pleurodeles waltl]|uniref:Uncharacterized protein n=1 Tax=Pleurodeles waltl TaxID=8319 RepID=A0AAV7M5F5_PLEWA|nr:hypothetical protein NDU88_003166 [Pleurodeles waltl]